MPGSDAAVPVPGAGASLQDWLTYLESIHPVEIELGLERVLLVMRRLLPAGVRSRVVTVGGTNGKGSTVAALEALLLRAGRSVGCYTSPHLLDYNERVRVNGQPVSDDVLIRAFDQVEAARGRVSLTYFEFGTLAAFLAMVEAEVDTMVLEVGLGGRLDAVNILDADLAIITSVDLDHMAWLGDDRETIGYEKAGILRPGQRAIYGDDSPPSSVLQQAAAQRVQLSRPGQDYRIDHEPSGPTLVTATGHRIPLPASGLPLNSLAAAAVAALELEPDLSDDAIAGILATTRLAGRFEQVIRAPEVYLDVGHNPHAAQWLAHRLTALKRGQTDRRVLAVYAGLEDKDSAGVGQALSAVVDQWYLAGLGVPRGLPVTALAERLQGVLPAAGIVTSATVSEALERALAQSRENDLVLVFGSFFTVVEGKRYFSRQPGLTVPL